MVADPLLLHWIALFGGTALGLGIGVVAVVALWRGVTDERPLLLSEVRASEAHNARYVARMKHEGRREGH